MINSKYELAQAITQDLIANDILNTVDYPDIPTVTTDVTDIIMQHLADLQIITGSILPDRTMDEE